MAKNYKIEQNLPGKMSAIFMNVHFVRLKVVELLANRGFIFGGQPCPGFISAPVILMARCDLNVVTKFDYL